MDVLCIGDVMLDVHARSGELALGGDVHGRVRVRPGGTSANAAVWAGAAGAEAGVIAAVGDDMAGGMLTAALEQRGIDTAGVVRRPSSTGVMLVLSEHGDRSMVADRGANAELRPADLPVTLDAGAVLVSGYLLLQEPGREVALAAIERAATPWLAVEAASWPLVEQAGPDRFFADTFAATVIFANESEAEALVGVRGPGAAAKLGARYRIAAVKRGASGAVLSVDGEVIEVAGDVIDEVDPTGAGDAFDGVLLAALAAGDDPFVALGRACHAGAQVAASADAWPELGATV